AVRSSSRAISAAVSLSAVGRLDSASSVSAFTAGAGPRGSLCRSSRSRRLIGGASIARLACGSSAWIFVRLRIHGSEPLFEFDARDLARDAGHLRDLQPVRHHQSPAPRLQKEPPPREALLQVLPARRLPEVPARLPPDEL